MNVERRILFTIAVLIFSVLACNLPAESETSDITIVPTETAAAVIETVTTNPTETPIPSTPTPAVSPEVILLKNSNCRLGPSTFYSIGDQIAEKKVLPVIGRNDDSTWWQVITTTGRECWIFNENTETNTDFSGLPIGNAIPLPGLPGQFSVIDQLCQPGPGKFTVTLSWVSGGGETSFRIFRNGKQVFEPKVNKFTYKDTSAPLNKNLSYEIEAVNSNGTSERAIQIVPACK